MSRLVRRLKLMHNGVVIDFDVVLPQFFERFRLTVEFFLSHLEKR